MAYLEQADAKRRATAIAGVATIHLALAAALILGLAVTGYRDDPGRMVAVNVRPEAPPPPPPTPRQQEPETPWTAPLPKPLPPVAGPAPEVWSTQDGTIVDPLPPGPTPSVEVEPARPTPVPSFAPKGAVPRGRPGSWITTEDYPARALRDGDEGMAGYQLVIGSSGKVTACAITRSSGSADLDRETCRLLSRRAQFDPATDPSGSTVVGTYSGSVRWDIPD